MSKITRRSFVNKFGFGVGAAAVITTLPSFLKVPEKNSVPYTGKKINIALCGLGRYAEILAEGITVSEYCHLAGIATGTPAKAAKWKSQYKISDKNIYDYNSFDSIINNKDIDMVYVVLPNAMHKEFVLRTAKAGKHVIVEKPMAITPEDCQEMMAACKKAGVQLAVGYRLHYEPNHLEIKRLGQDKVFGSVRYIEVGLGYPTYDRSKPDATVNYADKSEWHNYKKMSGGGSLINLGIYCIQASRYVLGEEPIAVTARFAPTNYPKRFEQVEETILWQMEFPSGAIANCSSSNGFGIDRFYASADDGSFELSPAVSYGPFKGKSPNGEFNFPVINQQQTQVDAICKLILENKPLPNHITGEEGLKDVRIIQAIYKAAETGKRISLV